MDSSLPLFSVWGIAIRMHITFPLILIWAALRFGVFSGGGWGGALFGVIVIILLFVIVIMHELGHSLAALRFGVPVKQIVLLPIGGVAQLSRIPEKPVQEFVIAIAGPLVNFGLAIVLALIGFIPGLSIDWSNLPALLEGAEGFSLASIFAYISVSNLFLGIFNLLPAFPMDGGRVLRALLATQLDYVQATNIAVYVGQAMAWLFGLWGFLGGGFFVILLAVFIFAGASQERQLVQVRNVLRGLTVEQAYSREPHRLAPHSTLRDAVDLTFSSFQADFPVCDDERLVGLLTHTRLLEALDRYSPDMLVSEVMEAEIEPVRPQDGLFAVQQRLAESNLDALPVVDQDRFLGLITNRDVSEVYRLLSHRPDLAIALTRTTQP